MTKEEKLLKKYLKICQRFCDDNGFNVSVKWDKDFGYYEDSEEVGVTLVSDERSQWFMENAFNRGLSYDCGDFIASFMHEIGHHFTLDKISRKQDRIINKRKRKLNGNKRKHNFKYFNILDEVLATNWAIDYINNNEDIIEQFAYELMDIIKEVKDI